jgi:hypothetical protein
MVIVRLRGGLGNQLFQFAAGFALSQHLHVEYKLDPYTYTKHKYRKLELGHFNIPFELASPTELDSYVGKGKLIRYLNKRENYLRCPKVVAQPHYHFYDDFFSLPADIYLSGYWQSEKYFQNVSNQIVDMYQPKERLDSKNLELIQQLDECNSIAIHVRRGDYTSGTYSGFFGGLTNDYYQDAVKLIYERVSNPSFFIFSDNPEWCRKNLNIKEAVYVDHNKGDGSYKDLVLMSKAKHNVIANSTFSWWGAWLNQNASKLVVAPKQWFQKSYNDQPGAAIYGSRYYNTKDLIPETWLKV